MKRASTFIALVLTVSTASAQEAKTFTTVREIPITSVKNQHRSGTCWDFATLGLLESEILRKTGKTYDLCEMFVVNKDYIDCATHYVRMHGYSQISEGGSCDDVIEVIRRHGICPEEAMPAPGSLTGDSLANFKVFFPELERTVSGIVRKDSKEPLPHWRDSVQALIEKYVGRCPESFEYEGMTYTPRTFAESLGLDLDDYVSLTSYAHHPFNQWFVIEAPYKWRLKPSFNIPIERLMDILDQALDAGYTVAWGGDVSGDFTRTGLAMLPDGVVPSQQLRQDQWDDWRFTYDHVMLIYGKAVDENGEPYYMVKNSWGRSGHYAGTWYMSRDYIALNTTYLFLNRHALPKDFSLSTAAGRGREHFVSLTEAVPDAILEIRYFSTYNFVGERIDGYQAPTALMTREAADSLRAVSDDVMRMGYRLKVYDAYRPQCAVDHFVRWAADVSDTTMRRYFYPDVDKSLLFKLDYIAEKSGHTRGSTVDLTLFDMNSEKELDMGGTFDWFGEESHPDYTGITETQFANRMILREAMLRHGFKPLESEWWHFTLRDEPFPDTYFSFPVR